MAYVFGAFELCPESEHAAARADSHNCGGGRLALDPRGLEFRVDALQRNARRSMVGPVARACAEPLTDEGLSEISL